MGESPASLDGVVVRRAVDADAREIRDLFITVYGADYPYVEFYDEEPIKKIIYSDDTIMLVAVDGDDGPIVGSASVMLEFGAYSDLVGEFGRLVVHPEATHRGIAGLLTDRRIAEVAGRLHLGLIEARVAHSYSQQNAERHGFATVGFLPLKLEFARRESAALLVRYFGDALALRRNNPRLVPEAYPMASMALANTSLPLDPIVDDHSVAYPSGGSYEIEDMTTRGYTNLLRMERGRLARREIFGPMRLHYGFFRLKSHRSSYMMARDASGIVGAVGFTRDDIEHTVRVFELISRRDDVVSFLLEALRRRCKEEWHLAYIEIDVSAHAPRMQRTLVECGFVPVAYVPALAFHDVERIDVVKMAYVASDVQGEEVQLTSSVTVARDLALSALSARPIPLDVRDAVGQTTLFAGLSDEQRDRVAGDCQLLPFNPGDLLFAEGDDADGVHLVLDGEVEIRKGKPDRPVGTVGPGETVGEVAMVLGGKHSAAAVATAIGRALVISRDRFSELMRQRPDIGLLVYRNLAVEMALKLKSSDLAMLRTR